MSEKFKVTKTEKRDELDERGRFYTVRRIYFDYADTETDYVDVAEAHYDPKTVSTKIEELVDKHLAILAL